MRNPLQGKGIWQKCESRGFLILLLQKVEFLRKKAGEKKEKIGS